MKNKQLTQLKKAYTKRVKLLNKNFTKDPNAGLLLFIEHLKCLRDTLIIKSADELKLTDEFLSADTKLMSLIVAISEFDAYQGTDDIAQKSFHWNNFAEFIKINMREWLTNDTI